jgi:succinate dehydrogenase/fumarate reductase flavoprotein subunit
MAYISYKTDILVVGGGLAGCFAAITAREKGRSVILAEKNYCGKSGHSNFARDMMLFHESWGDSLEDWRDQFYHIGEYINDRDWVDILLKEGYDRYRDMVRWGMTFYLREPGTVGMPGEDHKYGNAVVSDEVGFPQPEEEPFRYRPQRTKYRKSTAIVKFGPKDKMMVMRRKVLDSGCQILDRVVLTDLIKRDGRIVGAVGFQTQTGDFYLIEAKAVVMACGGLCFKPARFCVQTNTGDGVAMGYRAGGELVGMEFGSAIWVSKDCDVCTIDGPVAELGMTEDSFTNGKGEEFLDDTAHLPTNIHWPLEVHKGNGPLFHEPYNYDRSQFEAEIKKYNETAEGPWMTMMDRAGIDIFHDRFEQYMCLTGNIWPGGLRINTRCETNVPGLYAAGDSAGSNFTGPTYATLGSGMCHAACTGHRAGEYAADYAAAQPDYALSAAEIRELRRSVFAPLERGYGFTTEHILQRIRQTVNPYEVRQIMKEDRMRAALTMIEFFRDHFLPKGFAKDAHDLRNFYENRNMIFGAEVMLRTAIERKESRGWFFREDYPRRDDENWLKWIIVSRDDNGEMAIRTEDVPAEWQGDRSEPYEKRYTLQYRLDEEE